MWEVEKRKKVQPKPGQLWQSLFDHTVFLTILAPVSEDTWECLILNDPKSLSGVRQDLTAYLLEWSWMWISDAEDDGKEKGEE